MPADGSPSYGIIPKRFLRSERPAGLLLRAFFLRWRESLSFFLEISYAITGSVTT